MSRSPADDSAVDAVLTASRSMVAVATRSLGAAAEETTIAQYRALVVLASRGPQRLVDLASVAQNGGAEARHRPAGAGRPSAAGGQDPDAVSPSRA